MTLKANEGTCMRRTVLPQGSQSLDGACPPALPHRRELRAATTRSDFRGSKRPGAPRVIVPARRLLLRRRVGGC